MSVSRASWEPHLDAYSSWRRREGVRARDMRFVRGRLAIAERRRLLDQAYDRFLARAMGLPRG